MIYALIVTHNPNVIKLTSLVNKLIDSKVTPVVIDNASLQSFSVDCTLIRLDFNYGIAKAQNIGIKHAINQEPEAVIFFDQDSTIHDELFIQKLYDPIANSTTKISAPIFTDRDCGFTYPIVEIKKNGRRIKHRPSPKNDPFRVNNVISSGTMVELSALKEIGGMKEDLFIDYVDTEWCLRAWQKGFDILVIPSATMQHSIGDKTIKIGKSYIPKHSPSRRYYRIRNSFYLIRQSHIPKLMAIREIVFSIAHQLLLIAASPKERKNYIRSLLSGLTDGMLGKFN